MYVKYDRKPVGTIWPGIIIIVTISHFFQSISFSKFLLKIVPAHYERMSILATTARYSDSVCYWSGGAV